VRTCGSKETSTRDCGIYEGILARLTSSTNVVQKEICRERYENAYADEVFQNGDTGYTGKSYGCNFHQSCVSQQ
jgi:hypothetical protein